MGVDDRYFLANICQHLKPLVEAMLAGGAGVNGVTTMLDVNYALNLSNGLTPNLAITEAKQRGLEFDQSNDPHYAVEYFLICRGCRHGVAWPQSRAIVGTLRQLPDLSIN